MRQSTKDTLQGISGLAAIIFSFAMAVIFIPVWFASLDCNTAKHHLKYIEECRADVDCTLSLAESQRYKAYLRMKIFSCPKNDDAG